ncbi:MAG: hypothetical protein Q7R57_10370, partial [Dehalococcoidales bacterium]|nr:hypothetical protein [Dehalococcoidales bacterium]
MPKEKSPARTVFTCQQCGKESLKWLGRCPDCGQWNTFVETNVKKPVYSRPSSTISKPQELSQITADNSDRIP